MAHKPDCPYRTQPHQDTLWPTMPLGYQQNGAVPCAPGDTYGDAGVQNNLATANEVCEVLQCVASMLPFYQPEIQPRTEFHYSYVRQGEHPTHLYRFDSGARDMAQQNDSLGCCGDQVSGVGYWPAELPAYEGAMSQQNNATFSHEAFGSSPSARAKYSTLNREMQHRCWCEKVFKRKFDLKRHQTTHKEGKLLCHNCGRRFRRKDNLKEHERRHQKKSHV